MPTAVHIAIRACRCCRACCMRVYRACVEHCEFLDVCITPDVCINMCLQRERGHRRPWLHGCLHDLLGWDLWESVEGRGGRARLACREGAGRLVGRVPNSVGVTSAGGSHVLLGNAGIGLPLPPRH